MSEVLSAQSSLTKTQQQWQWPGSPLPWPPRQALWLGMLLVELLLLLTTRLWLKLELVLVPDLRQRANGRALGRERAPY